MSRSLLRDVLKRNQLKLKDKDETDADTVKASDPAPVDPDADGPSSSGSTPRPPSIAPSTGSGHSTFNPNSSKRSIKNFLRPGSSSRSITSSIRSSGAASLRSIASLAESMVSFYSMLTGGGSRIPKRRRPDFSRLGVPEWYEGDPPEPPLMPGTAPATPVPPIYTRGISSVIHERVEGEPPYVGIVMYSHAFKNATMPMYHNGARVQGEVRLNIRKKEPIKSIDVWLTISMESVLDIYTPAMYAMTMTVWKREMGDPRKLGKHADPKRWEGSFPKGTFVFPFEFLELPSSVVVKHPMDGKRRNQARVPMPPTFYVSKVVGFSGSIKFLVGVNIVRDGYKNNIDDEFDMPFQYFPLCKRIPQAPTPFPFIPTREDWPFSRETVGGWILTPFGGRGRLGEEIVEVEGILGVQDPPVVTANDTLSYSLLLWSKNALALEALGQPAALEVLFCKSDGFGWDVMTPRTSTRKNRYVEKLAEGRAWRTDDGRPDDDAPKPEFVMVQLPEPKPKKATPGPEGSSYRLKGAPSKRMKEFVIPEEDEEEDMFAWKVPEGKADTSASEDEEDPAAGPSSGSSAASSSGSEVDPDEKPPSESSQSSIADEDDEVAKEALLNESESTIFDDAESTRDTIRDDQSTRGTITRNYAESVTTRAPSPTPSEEGVDEDDIPEQDHFVRLDGEVKVPACSHPSFRYTHMGREYILHISINHPQYNHISPSNTTGITTESPVWYVLDRFAHLEGKNLGPPRIQSPEELAKLPVTGPEIQVNGKTTRAPKVVGHATTEKRPTGKYVRYYAF
ncbi:hypothetical protein HMN09_00219900 [Mycena chlorophos]|uniref:Arrestin-like N-terminal domain-containing protein n=1 Tax=Mycena chlorophos TaxID=658473 RepID=A0A8H6TKM0_MYCCL|nr:hypothetical protein HMN09_00219900 [Mycena chlorophos]